MFKNFLGIKAQVNDLAEELKRARDGIEKLQRQREDILNAPATKTDVKAIVKGWLDAQAAQYNKGLAPQLLGVARHAASAAGINRDPISLANISNLHFGPQLFNCALAGLLGPTIYESLATTIDAMEWPEHARALEGRAAAVADIDKKLSKLIEEERSLTAAARDAIEGVRNV